MTDLFNTKKSKTKAKDDYSAKDIKVLEGLEHVRRRPGMYIGGTDLQALHHLPVEILDNSVDEAVAGYASEIGVELHSDYSMTISDNGRGIPVDEHPQLKGKSALEVIFTTLHSGGKFENVAYSTAGGLHGVGASVVNALSDRLTVEVARDKAIWQQSYVRGTPQSPLKKIGTAAQGQRGTRVTFHPDAEIFGEGVHFRPERIYKMARSKAYLYRGVTISWKCAPELLKEGDEVPATDKFHFPGGLKDYLAAAIDGHPFIVPQVFADFVELADGAGKVEWAIGWPEDPSHAFAHSYCNTIHTPQGGTHESGLRSAIIKGLRSFGELTGNRRVAQLNADDALDEAAVLLSVFITNPQFQGQTKEKLSSAEAAKLVETAVKDRFEQWLSSDPQTSAKLLEVLIARADERARAKEAKEVGRKTATRKLRLPGKLADCRDTSAVGTELFLVEGDSAGGSAKQARDRERQAILPLRGKILNVASASIEKMRANQEISDLIQALGCGAGADFDLKKLRYDRTVIMTDADVDGAHIASLLMTFFYKEMPELIRHGHLYLAMPPLYRISAKGKSVYARDDAHREELLRTEFKNAKVEVSRFKGLGEMLPAQLRETTMNPKTRTLIRVHLPMKDDPAETDTETETRDLIERLMGKKPELRFQFIQQNARFVEEVDV